MDVNYFKGLYTLSNNAVLRKGFENYSLYDVTTALSTKISLQLYLVFDLFLNNITNLTEIQSYFDKNEFKLDMGKVNDLFNEKKHFREVIVSVEENHLENVDEFSYRHNDYIYSKDFFVGHNSEIAYEYTPEHIDFFITNKCNLSCPHCYRDASNKDIVSTIDMIKFKSIVDEMENLRVQSIKVTGGEPFLVPNFYDVVEYISSKRIYLVILSNCTLPLDQKWLNLLTKENITVCTSLDGATPITHNRIRGKGSFEKTIKNLKLFKDYNVKFLITFTANIFNIHELEEVYILANNLGAETLHYNIIEETGRATKNMNLINDDISVKVQDFINKNKSRFKKKQLKVDYTDNHGLAEDTRSQKNINDKGDSIVCSAGFSTLAIDAQFNVFPCIFGIGGKKDYPIGCLENSNLLGVWRSEKLDVFRGKLKVSDLPTCSRCELSPKCMLKYCRLRPIYEGKSFFDPVSFCEHNTRKL